MADLLIRFQGEEFLLIGNLEEGGAVATVEQFENGVCSHAHLFEDGLVMRLGEQIGSVLDIEVIGEYDPKPTAESVAALFEGLTGPTWIPDEE